MRSPCRYCGNDRKLIKAHVIPEGFFRRMREGELAPLLVGQQRHTRKAPIGVYDQSILCESCEPTFEVWDGYSQQILSREIPDDAERVSDGFRVIGWKVHSYRYDLLKLFFISLLWRASVSTLPFFKRINLGPFEAQAKSLIENGDPGGADDFAVLVGRFEDGPSAGVILDPHPSRLDGIRYSRFYLGNYVAFIKTDTRPSVGSLKLLAMQPGESLQILARNLERGKEMPLMREIVATAKAPGMR